MDLKKELNHNQFLAASSKSQYLRIIAGAGTGKTRTLTYRLAYQIMQGMDTRRMVAITFTNKAAKEMLTRVDDLLQKEQFNVVYKPLICTFHGFCYRFLKREITHAPGYSTNFQIAGEDESGAIYKEIFSHMTKGSSKQFVQDVVSKISSLKTDGKFPDEVFSSDVPLGALYTYDELIKVYREYQRQLKIQNLLDFDDLLMLTVLIMEKNDGVREYWQSKFDVFLVDEFQDTNYLQYYLIKLFMSKSASLTVVGDPDQTIYTWRGAKNEIIKDVLLKDFPHLETVVLDENYRSTQNILDASNKLIKNNKDRMDKKLIAASGVVGDKVSYFSCRTNEAEAYQIAQCIRKLHMRGIPYSSVAIIYRANYLSNVLEKQMTIFKIPYEIYGGMKFYERAEIKDACAYLKVAINPDDFSFKRILKAPTKGVGETTLARAVAIRDKVGDENINLLTVFRNYQDELSLNKKSKLALGRFYEAYDEFLAKLSMNVTGDELISAIQHYFNMVGFLDFVHEEDQKAEKKLSYTASSSVSKVDNVNELLRTITSFLQSDILNEDGSTSNPTLEDFLIEVALQSDQDTMKDTDKVALMTGHVSKGLEFPYVFLTGLNDMIFPTTHAMMDPTHGGIEEERRLLYVCMTRAKVKLTISSFGGTNFRTGAPYMPSMFLKEIGLSEKMNESETNTSITSQRPLYEANRGIHRPSLQNNLSSNAMKYINKNPVNNSSADNSYVIGDRVAHTSFGVGTVIAVEGDKIKVRFAPEFGEKKLQIGFRAFRKLKDGE